MAPDTLDLVEGTAAGLALGVLYQAVEDRVPSAQVDLYTGGVALAGFFGGLGLMHTSRRRSGGSYEVGKALTYGSAALAGAQATRFVDGKYLKLTIPAGFEGDRPQVVSQGGAPSAGASRGASRATADF